MKEFKVGERVKVYGDFQDLTYNTCVGHTGEILGIHSSGRLKVEFDEHAADGGLIWELVFPQQCRKLVKRKLKEFWIVTGGPVSYARVHFVEQCLPAGDFAQVHVREVRPRKV